MTEEEARDRLCPFQQGAVLCVGRICMGWSWDNIASLPDAGTSSIRTDPQWEMYKQMEGKSAWINLKSGYCSLLIVR